MRYLVAFLILLSPLALATPHEARIPLHDGNVRLADFSDKLLTELHCPQSVASKIHLPGTIDARNLEGSKFIEAMNVSLGDACRLSLDGDTLLLHVDCDKMPKNWDATKLAIRVFTAYAAPEYTAAQQREFGLLLPKEVDERKPLVVLVHGLDCTRRIWSGLAPLLEAEGYQIAYFGYPAGQPISDSAQFLADNLTALHELYPDLRLDVITHSMGSLVARQYIEGANYTGGVSHLILLTPPNSGSGWAHAEVLLKAQQQFYLARNDPDWHWTWIITDGMGEAATDLLPNSKFLKQLNTLPRRDGVKYTIVAGNRNPGWTTAGDMVAATSRWFPRRIENWWGFRHTKRGLEKAAAKLRNHESDNDGPVSLKSAKLDGVSDFVVLPTDHASIYCATPDTQPPAWPTIRDRLAH